MSTVYNFKGTNHEISFVKDLVFGWCVDYGDGWKLIETMTSETFYIIRDFIVTNPSLPKELVEHTEEILAKFRKERSEKLHGTAKKLVTESLSEMDFEMATIEPRVIKLKSKIEIAKMISNGLMLNEVGETVADLGYVRVIFTDGRIELKAENFQESFSFFGDALDRIARRWY